MKKNPRTVKPECAAAVVTGPGGVTQGLDPEARGKSILALHTAADDAAELLIYGPIGDYYWGDGITAASIVEQLGAITASTINVRINSDGGVVSEGLAIYNALQRHDADIIVTVDGFACSIASLIAMAGDTVRMPENSMMMLHAPIGGAWGNAAVLREVADVLDTMASAMTASYAAKSKRAADITQMLTDGRDHWFTAAQAHEFGLCDEVVTSADDEPEAPVPETAAAAALLSYVHAINSAQGVAFDALRNRIRSTTTPTAFASLSGASQRAVFAQLEENSMLKQQCHQILAQAGGAAPSAAATPTETVTAASAPGTAAHAPPVDADAVVASIHARNTAIRGVFVAFADIPGVRELETACLADPRMTVEQAQSKLLSKISGNAAPLNDVANGTHIEAVRGGDQQDKDRERAVQGILARAGALTGAEADAARQGNPNARLSLTALAEASLIRAQVNTRSMTREEIANRVLAVQTTSDFPVLLESVLHRMLLNAYNATAFTWQRFCSIGALTDYRPHSRYHVGSFSDLKPVNEAGEYENGVLSDGAKETIQGKRRGRILQITPEILVNDDLGALTQPTQFLGQGANRTIEKDVLGLFALNSGAGPTMSDGNPLFDASHNNVATTAAAPTVASWDAMRQLLGSQKDPGGNDFLDIVPALWLGPLSLGTAARTVNTSEFNQDVSSKYAPPNTSRGMVRDVIDTPRLSGNAWYMFADPSIEPVIEVAFLDGVQTPTIEQEKNFRTDGLAWKVVHRYGVAAVGWRGAAKNNGVSP